MPDGYEECAAHVLDGGAEVAGSRFAPGRMLVFRGWVAARAPMPAAGERALQLAGINP